MNNEEKILSILETMQNSMEAMQAEQRKTNERLDRLESGIADMKADISSVDKRLATVSDSVVRIEHEHGKKLDALFDGYQQMYDKVSHIEEHVSVQDDIILKRVFPKAAER